MASNDAIKRFEVRLDLKRTLPAAPFEVVQGDTGTVIAVKVYNDGETVGLEDKYVTAVFGSTGGTSFQASDDGSITLSGNTAEISLLPTAVTPGQVSCELQIYACADSAAVGRDDYDLLVTSARFCFRVRKPMLNDEALEAIPQTPLLIALLSEAEDAEADRAAAEAQRAEAEAARQAAEAEREALFASMSALGAGAAIVGSGEPTGSVEALPGRLYFDTANRQVFVCSAVQNGATVWRKLQMADGDGSRIKVERSSTYLFSQLPTGEAITLQELVNRLAGWYQEIDSKQDGLTFDSAPTSGSTNPVRSGGVYDAVHYGDWVTLYDSTIQSDTSIVNISRRDAAHGGSEFAFDELKLVMIGGMTGGVAVRLYLNSYTSSYMVFNQFAISDPDAPEKTVTELSLEKPVAGVAAARRCMGGDAEDTGRSVSYAAHRAALVLDGITNYTAIRLTGDSVSTKFAAGTRFVLQGRNTR